MQIGVFNLQKVLKSAPQIPVMQTKLKDQFRPAGKKLLSSQANLKKDIKKYRDVSTVRASYRGKLQKDIIAKQNKIKAQQNALKHNFILARNKQLQAVLNKIKVVVAKIAKKRGLDLVISNANVAYNNKSMDITDQIIKALK